MQHTKNNTTAPCIMRYKIFITIALALISLGTKAQNFETIECEDTCRHIHGIDVSHYQGNIFWEVIGENTKMTYVYIKCTEGGDRIDDRYADNIQLAHRYGLKVGSYHFYRPKADQEKQFENFITQCRRNDQDLIPMIDVESTGGLGTEELCDSLFKFLGMVEKHYRQKPLIYTGANFYDKHFQHKLDDYKIMIAQYTQREPKLKDDRDITLWQYTGKGHINGINGYVDKSRFMGKHTLRELKYRHR